MAAGWALPVLAFALVASPSAGPLAAGDAPLFPQPFVVEHQVFQTLPDGDVFATDPVTDYYAGSRIISVRADGSRLVVDLASRELTEIRPERGSYSVVTFDRFAALSERLRAVERTPSAAISDAEPALTLTVAEVAVTAGLAKSADRDPLAERHGVRHLQVSAAPPGGEPVAVVELWLDPTIRLSAAAREALERLEATLSGGGQASFSALLGEARRHGGSAFPFRSSRPLSRGSADAGSVEDVALRIALIAALPAELLELPEGLERAPHPLELMVAGREAEAELRQQMAVTR
jgi:hypothetical protein